MRRILGIIVIIAGILGLVLSLAGLIGLFALRPALAASAHTTVGTLVTSTASSQQAMTITTTALGGAVESVDALSSTLSATADSLRETRPVITQMNSLMGQQLPDSLQAAVDSLATAGQAAQSLEGAIKSLDTFRSVVAAIPLLSSFIPAGTQPYKPDKPLATSLNELALSLRDMPASFEQMATGIDRADDNLALIESNLGVMSGSIEVISTSLHEYETLVIQSSTSLDELNGMLQNLQDNLDRILTISTIILALFFFWLLAAQAVILSQGVELYRGTATHME